ncbi:MAG: glycosyltransferase [Bacteroidales bacterium]|nr:glycosyltransferase [Bacteroidales bacterium]
MKIAHITSVHPQNDNRIFYKECTTLLQEGYDVTLIVAGGETKKVNGIQIIGYSKIKVGRLKRIVKTSLLDMIKICKEVDADLYHFHDPELIFTGLYLKFIGKKVIYDIHENNPASILSKAYIKSKFLKRFLSKTFNFLEKSSVKFFDAVVTARPDISTRFKHKHLITLRNFPILADMAKIKEVKIIKIKPSVIFVGGMSSIRGIPELIKAFKLIPEIELWLLGPIKEKEIEEEIKKQKNIKYFGIVEACDVFAYIDKADIGIITFLSVPNHLSTLATKPFEYMACAKPMIMSDFAYWKEIFGENSLYVDPTDIQSIAQTIKKLIKDEALRVKMGVKNLELSKNEYNWEKESQKLIILYKELS